MDSDRILVMEQGAVGEFDTPEALLGNPQSLFALLVNQWNSQHKGEEHAG